MVIFMIDKSSYSELEERIKKLEKKLNRCKDGNDVHFPATFYKIIVEQAADAIYVHDMDGRYVECNQAACDMLGYTRHDLLQKSVPEVDKEVDFENAKHLWEGLEEGDNVFFPGNARKLDGSLCPVDVRLCSCMSEGKKYIIAIVRDMTEIRMKEDALRKSKMRYRAVVDTQTELICRWKPGGELTFVNEAYCRYFSKDKSQLIKTNFFELIPKEDHEKVKKHFASLTLLQPTATHEHRVIMPNGDIRWMSWINRAIFDDQGKIIEMQDVGRDITDCKQAKEHVKEMQAKLNHADKMAALGQLVAGVAHEVNNSINFISGALPSLKLNVEKLKDVLKQQAAPPANNTANSDLSNLVEEIAILFENINQGTKRSVKIINDLRSFSSPKKEKGVLTDVHAILDSILALLRYQYRDRIEIIKKYSAENSTIFCFPNHLSQAFMNVILNGVQAISGKGVITILTKNNSETIMIGFRDNGCGIHKEIKNKIFEPFFTTKDVGEGTGLGLSISYGIVKNILGEILVDSDVGRGTEFTIILPLMQKSSAVRRTSGNGLDETAVKII